MSISRIQPIRQYNKNECLVIGIAICIPCLMPVWNEGKFLTSPFSFTINVVRGGLECLHFITLPGADLIVIEIIIISLMGM